ncbi:FMN-binding protein [Caldichromatium japonicum]|uniref:FMN-binding protein n=2 Tax=Caldichromatium japonicum TaxID=2699430 RepID=A0A6G7VGU6_9GAMM|nr:FMN-binding protein [Caldichromatium japonicum]
MLLALGGVALLAGLAVALVDQFTAPLIAEQQRLRTERAVFEVLPGATGFRTLRLTSNGLEEAPSGPGADSLYAAYDAAGELVGVAIIGSGPGYAGPVQAMFAYRPACRCITASRILRSNETPGFGDKLGFDPEFLENFKSLDARLNAEGTALAHPIVAVRHGTKTEPWQIDAIAGATISSRALARAADSAANRAVPAIERHLDRLTLDASLVGARNGQPGTGF